MTTFFRQEERRVAPAVDRQKFEVNLVPDYSNDMEEFPRQTSPTAKWTKRVGFVAFLFFLIKGLLWLVVPAIIAYFAIGDSN